MNCNILFVVFRKKIDFIKKELRFECEAQLSITSIIKFQFFISEEFLLMKYFLKS